MPRSVWITGLGTVTAAGVGIDPLWETVCAGESRISRIERFDPSGFASQIAGEVRDFKANKIVPKSYRKSVKLMAQDIELAMGAADCAVRDAELISPGSQPDDERTYPATRTGCNIGAGLIAAELNELTYALATASTDDGQFDLDAWGRAGMNELTPLWLLKYLPNMLSCHVTILHDCQGPSNTITCAEASGTLSIGESLRVIQRNAADMSFAGGAESKLNEMGMLRQHYTNRLCTNSNDQPQRAVRPFDREAAGTAMGEGGGLVILEAAETARARGAKPYAELVGFGAGQTHYPQGHSLEPDPRGHGLSTAIRAALREAQIEPDRIQLIVPFGTGIPSYDRAEATALYTVFGDGLADIPLFSAKPYIGNCFAGSGAIDLALAARMVHEQKIPARINCDQPIDDLNCATAEARDGAVEYALVCTTSMGGQNAALVLKKV